MDPQQSRQATRLNGFAQRLKTKSHEQFQLLLCDATACDAEQSTLLDKILVDTDGHRSVLNWSLYVEFARRKFGDRKSQLQRLVNKALELVSEEDNKDSCDYLKLHLCSAQLKRYDFPAHIQSSACNHSLTSLAPFLIDSLCIFLVSFLQ